MPVTHKAARPRPRNRRAQEFYEAGVEQMGQQRWEEAVVLLRAALGLDPRHSSAANDLGVLMEALGNPSEALCYYRSAAEADPEHTEAQINLAALQMQMEMARALARQPWNVNLAV